MSDSTVHVTAHLRARPDTRSHLQRELAALTEPTRAEPGCLRYDLFQQPEQPDQFLFIEQWRSQADFERHLQQPHIEAFMQAMPDLLAEPMQVGFWQPVE